MSRAPVALIAAAALLAGCHSTKRRAAPLPAADRSAYFEIASDSGALRGATVRAYLGRSRRIDTGPIAAARTRLAKLRPADPLLASLRGQLARAAAAAVASSPGARRRAAAAVAATDSVNAGLRRYAARHPGVAALIPD